MTNTYRESNPVFLDAVSFHPKTTFDEAEFLGLLSASLALTISEKKRLIGSISLLSQTQIDEVLRVFKKEEYQLEQSGIEEAVRELKRQWNDWIANGVPPELLDFLDERDKRDAEWEALRQGLLAEQASKSKNSSASLDFLPPTAGEIAKIGDFLTPYNVELVKQLSRRPADVYLLSPRQFEILLAEIIHDLGWEVELTPESNDGGRDIIATIPFGTSRLLGIIECKKYSPHNKVGIEIVERFVHTVRDKDRASFGMIATSSYFTQGAWDVAQRHQWQLQLNDFDSLCHLLKNYGHYEPNANTGLWVMKKV